MEILYRRQLDNLNLRYQVKKFLVLCNADFSPPLSENRRTHPSETIDELVERYLVEKDGRHHYLLAMENETILGFMNFETDVSITHFPMLPKSVHVDTSCVHPKYRNQQVGQSLYSFFEKNIPSLTNNELVTRSTWESNLRQIHLFEKMGYRFLDKHLTVSRAAQATVYYAKSI